MILLDLRYFRDVRPRFGFGFDSNKDMLGEEQWIWFENELKNTNANWILIGSGTQFFPDDRIVLEYWFKNSRKRLINFIQREKINGTIFISGDVHWGEIMTYPCWKRDIGYDIHEITSSGLSHNLGFYVKILDDIVGNIFPETYNQGRGMYVKFNFGMVNIYFNNNESNSSHAQLEIRNIQGNKIMNMSLDLDQMLVKDYDDVDAFCIVDILPIIRLVTNISFRMMKFEWQAWLVGGLLMIIFILIIVIEFLFYKCVKYFHNLLDKKLSKRKIKHQ